MNTVVRISRSDERLEAASRWVLKLDEGLTPDQRAGLEAWLAENPKNAPELMEVAKAWDKLDSLGRLADLFPLATAKPEHTPPVWRRRPALAIAAIALVAVAATLFVTTDFGPLGPGSDPTPAVTTARYDTAVGEQKTVLLPDGSEVVLNTNSRLGVRYSGQARVLRLYRGEIHVSVAEDRARPLSVVAGDRIVQAVGTSFSVEITDEDHVELMVTEGKVVVGVRPVGLAPTQPPPAPGGAPPDDNLDEIASPPVLAQSKDNTVEAGQTLMLGAPDEKIVPVTPEDIEVKLSWKQGSLIFRSEPLDQALREVERYTTVQFVLLDEELKTRTLSGRFRAGDVDALLASLEANFQIVHRYEGDNRVLLRSN